nr:PREDICTED: carboxypeptidase B-like isoform X1 [Bemisia tabaci]
MLRAVLCVCLLASASAARSRSRSDESVESKEDISIEEVSKESGSAEDESSEEYGVNRPQSPSQISSNEEVSGAKVFRVSIKDKNDERDFERIRSKAFIDMLHRSKSDVDILVRPSTYEKTKDLLRSTNLDYEVLIDDLGKRIELENPAISEETAELVGRQGHKLTFEHYHRVEDQHGYLDYLAETYKDYVTLESIGTSHEGRELKLIKISSGYPNASAIWIDGGIHAREWIASATVLHIVRELTEYRDNLPEEMKQVDYYVVPMVNPDGYEFSHSAYRNRLWRKNRAPGSGSCQGVDLNRNYGYKWGGKGTSNYKCSDIFRGAGPNSEPETKAIANYIGKKKPEIQGFLTFHSYGQYILYPWGYDKKLPPDYEDLQRVGDIAAQRIKEKQGVKYKVGNSANMLYAAAGAADDWAKAYGKVKYTYTVELRDEGSYGFVLPSSEITACGKDGFEVVRAVAEALVKTSGYRRKALDESIGSNWLDSLMEKLRRTLNIFLGSTLTMRRSETKRA